MNVARIDSELSWWFGTGPSTAAGDSGLRSSLGGQLEALKSETVGTHATDAGRIEDDVIRRVGTGALMREIRERLSMLPRATVLVLELHYSTRPIALGVSGCAVLCDEAARLVRPAMVTREGLAAALREDAKAEEKPGATRAWVTLDGEATALLRAAQAAYDAIRIPRRRRVWAE